MWTWAAHLRVAGPKLFDEPVDVWEDTCRNLRVQQLRSKENLERTGLDKVADDDVAHEKAAYRKPPVLLRRRGADADAVRARARERNGETRLPIGRACRHGNMSTPV